MNKAFIFIATSLVIALSNCPSVWAYGGGGGGSASCSEAKFYDETPAKNSVLSSLSEIAVVASDNTDISSILLKVNDRPLKPETSQRRSGEWDLKLRLPEPISQPGKVRITLEAKSKEGCWTLLPYFLEIK